MCELYLHAAVAPTRDHPWLGDFLDHGGADYGNTDGWGLAAYADVDAQLFHEPVAATASALCEHVRADPPETHLLIAHIREASAGGISLANTQPLSRMVGGRRILFAHNGSVKPLRDTQQGQQLESRALGTADSEIALLHLLDWLDGRDVGAAVDVFADYALRMSAFGPYNVIVSDGRSTLAYSDRRHHHADGPDAPMRGPGLFKQMGGDGSVVLSSEPLGNNSDAIPRGTMVHIRRGEIVTRIAA